MPEEKSLFVNINGNPYKLRSEDSLSHLQTVAGLVDDKIQTIKKQYPYYSLNRMAVLAALQLADEYLKLKDEYDQLLKEMDMA